MSHWDYWEWLAYATMWVGAIILAADGGLKMAPILREKLPKVMKSHLLAFIPLICIILATVVLLSREFGLIGNESKRQFLWVSQPPHILVAGKRITNERVPLDGHVYRDCIFENVTFVFNGTEPFELTNNSVVGRFVVTSENPAIDSSADLFRGLGLIPEQIEFRLPPGVKVEPMKKGVGPPP